MKITRIKQYIECYDFVINLESNNLPKEAKLLSKRPEI